jgi:rare lipoprotein A
MHSAQTETADHRSIVTMIIHRLAGPVALILLWAGTSLAASPSPDLPAASQEAEKLAQLPPLAPNGNVDNSGRKQRGRASYYAHRFADRKMANGNRFNPNSDVAASTTLPLGTTAKVTNLSNGRTATVKVVDRGPYRTGRVIDVAPKVADQLDMKQAGVAPVTVAPIAVPQSDGAVKLGAGAAEVSPEEVAEAAETAKAATTPVRSAAAYLKR